MLVLGWQRRRKRRRRRRRTGKYKTRHLNEISLFYEEKVCQTKELLRYTLFSHTDIERKRDSANTHKIRNAMNHCQWLAPLPLLPSNIAFMCSKAQEIEYAQRGNAYCNLNISYSFQQYTQFSFASFLIFISNFFFCSSAVVYLSTNTFYFDYKFLRYVFANGKRWTGGSGDGGRGWCK